ncbi:MAG: PhoH family protein [Verrucomicrobia bacterium]|nr:PhoH family protein [Verrucomicrobiota bacterium]
MASHLLQFDDPRELLSLYLDDPRNLQRVEETLGVRCVARDNWLKIEGEEKKIEQALHLFEELRDARENGIQIRRHEFNYALQSVARNGAADLRKMFSSKIGVSPRKRPIAPKTLGQQQYVEAIRANDIAFGIGPAGTGKTYLAMAMAVSALQEERVSRIILARPAVEAGESLGFLPGTFEEKVTPYLRPLYDALYDMMPVDEIQRQMERGVIEIAPLAFMRGRTLNHSFVILDEAQNATAEQMFMFLTRLGFDSKCVVTGDITQVDLPTHKRSGLIQVQDVLRGVGGIAFVYLTEKDVVRHELVQQIIKRYDEFRAKRGLATNGDKPATP